MQCENIGNIRHKLLVRNNFLSQYYYRLLARPCCTGILGDCILTSKEDCLRRRGFFHPRAHLCSQVIINSLTIHLKKRIFLF